MRIVKLNRHATATDAEREEARDQTQALQDWARLPSIRDAALAARAALPLMMLFLAITCNTLADAESHGSTFSSDYRGNPSKPGFFTISICSNRHVQPREDCLLKITNVFIFLIFAPTRSIIPVIPVRIITCIIHQFVRSMIRLKCTWMMPAVRVTVFGSH